MAPEVSEAHSAQLDFSAASQVRPEVFRRVSDVLTSSSLPSVIFGLYYLRVPVVPYLP